MSQDWTGGWSSPGRFGPGGSGGGPGGGRSGGRNRGGRPSTQQRREADEARAALQDQFYRVDQLQSDIGGTVRLYAVLLPERAARTGVVPGWTELDRQASALIVDYLEVLDRHDPIEEAGPMALSEATRAFAQLTPRLGLLGNDLDGFVERFGPELTKVGQAREEVSARVAAANAAVERAEAAWRGLADVGLQFDSADQAVAQARIAARKLTTLAPRLTPETVDEPVAVVERLASEAHTLATTLPRRAAALGRRIPSLKTRVEALENRAAGVPEVMRTLRREYAAGNWDDLAHQERDLAASFADARSRLAELGRRHAAGDVPGSLQALDGVEAAVDALTEMVDAPRLRLELLRRMSSDPRHLFDEVRFRLRDARYLILGDRGVARQPWAGRLDAAASELLALEPLVRVAHPDYWDLHLRLDALDVRVRRLIDDVRARA